MTATALFDSLAREDASDQRRAMERLAQLADKLVEAALADLQRVRGYEQQFGPPPDGSDAVWEERSRSIYQLYQEWARETGDVLSRAKQVTETGHAVKHFNDLVDEYGRIRARLSITPDQLAQRQRQAQAGQVIPAAELRNELRARLRA